MNQEKQYWWTESRLNALIYFNNSLYVNKWHLDNDETSFNKINISDNKIYLSLITNTPDGSVMKVFNYNGQDFYLVHNVEVYSIEGQVLPLVKGHLLIEKIVNNNLTRVLDFYHNDISNIKTEQYNFRENKIIVLIVSQNGTNQLTVNTININLANFNIETNSVPLLEGEEDSQVFCRDNKTYISSVLMSNETITNTFYCNDLNR